MIEIEPCSDSNGAHAEIDGKLNALVGLVIADVKYWGIADSAVPVCTHHVGFDSVRTGVELIFADFILGLRWKMEQFRVRSGVVNKHGISLLIDPDDGFLTTRSLVRQNTPLGSAWDSLIGQQIVEVAAGWHLPSEGAPQCLWTVRCSCVNGKSFTVSLGRSVETGQDDPTFAPDHLVVIFEQTLANRYRIPAGLQSAWGGSY